MPGTRGLNSKLRALIAKLQREMDFPTVYAMKFHFAVKTKPGLPPCPVTCQAAPEFSSTTKDGLVSLNPRIVKAEIETPTVQVDTLLNQRNAQIKVGEISLENLSCLQVRVTTSVSIHHFDAAIEHARVWGRVPQIGAATTRGLSHSFLTKRRVHAAIKMMEAEPITSRFVPLTELPKGLILRYRAQILKILGWNALELEWAGVSGTLPPIPLRPLGVTTSAGRTCILLEWTARYQSHMEGRILAMVRKKGSKNWLYIPIREG